jgi:hypothetical protein
MRHNSSPFKWRHFEPSLILFGSGIFTVIERHFVTSDNSHFTVVATLRSSSNSILSCMI